jgi:hypothetical protein
MINICETSAESVTAAFTVVLAVATIVLCGVTWLLAHHTKKDFTIRKREATVSAWSEARKITPIGGFRQLGSGSDLTSDERTALREMEYFSSCVNSGVYDAVVLERISGSWFLQQYKNIEPYIGSRPNKRAYRELRTLHQEIVSIRARSGHQDD